MEKCMSQRVPKQLSTLIYNKRRALNMSRLELAEQLTQLGYECTESAINHWENNRARPPVEDANFVFALASSLEIPPSEIAKASGILDLPTETAVEILLSKLTPKTIELLKQASPNSIKKVEAVIRTMLTEEE